MSMKKVLSTQEELICDCVPPFCAVMRGLGKLTSTKKVACVLMKTVSESPRHYRPR